MIGRAVPPRIANSLAAHPSLYGPAAPHGPVQPPCYLRAASTPALDITTDHAGLVLLGKFAPHRGLIERLQTVPLAQRTRTHPPQAKLIQFFVGILAGRHYLQDFTRAAQPLVTDHAVHTAWQQAACAHYSGLSRPLAVADDAPLTALQQVLQEVSHPFLEREVLALVRAGRPVVLDVDLTGRRVRPTSTSYPDADFGGMDDAVANGYQAPIATLSGGPSGRLVLCSQRYPGRTRSAECLREAVRQMEQVLDVHPRRRPAFVPQRLATLAPQLQQRRSAVETAQQRQEQLRRTTERVQAELVKRRNEREEAADLAPQAGKMRLRRRQQQAERLVGQRHAAADWRAKPAAHLRELEHQEQQRSPWLEELERDNAALVMPVRMVLRVDAGFSTGENLAWLIAAGYAVVTKAQSGHTTTRLRRKVRLDAVWSVVGGHADAVALGPQQWNDCPYEVEVLLVRYQVPAGERWSALLDDEEPAPECLGLWFRLYNGRQIMEAGIKEQQAVFTMRRPLVRSRFGLPLQEQLSVFAATCVRWAAQWARAQVVVEGSRLQRALTETKRLVRVVGQTRARLLQKEGGSALVFDEEGPCGGSVLIVVGQVAYQQVLPRFHSGGHLPDELRSPLIAQPLG